MDILIRIKQLVLEGSVRFTRKADEERDADDLTVRDVFESILNASRIDKTIKSTVPGTGRADKLYIIKGLTFGNILLYTKGKIKKEHDGEVFYILISSKRSA